jgi:hypothetical protein
VSALSPSFENILRMWEDDIVRITLTTGEQVAGVLNMYSDGQTATITGVWTHTTSGWKLFQTDRIRCYRTHHIIGVEWMADEEEAS